MSRASIILVNEHDLSNARLPPMYGTFSFWLPPVVDIVLPRAVLILFVLSIWPRHRI